MRAFLRACCAPTLITLLSVLFLSGMCFAKSSTELGSRHDIPQEEVTADSNICFWISDSSAAVGYSDHYWYGSLTTTTSIHSAATGLSHAFSITYHIGHGDVSRWTHYWGWPWEWHVHEEYFVEADNGDWVFDYGIYEHSVERRVKFTFLWACHQGDEIGYMCPYLCGDQPRGMPFVWLHTSSLSQDGYGNPDGGGYCFIGFAQAAPFLTYDNLGGLGVTDACYYFLQDFYHEALYLGYYNSVNAALDYAALSVWGTDYEHCVLKTGYILPGMDVGSMQIYGDGGMHISDWSGGGGGCPFLYVWNGQRYVIDNNLLPAAEMSNGTDVNDYYRIERPLTPIYDGQGYSLCSLKIRESEHEHDYLDQIDLLAVDHGSDSNVAVTPDGVILTYKTPMPPLTAIDNEGRNVLSELSAIDENYYQSYNGSYVTLQFAPTDLSNGARLVIRDDRPPVLKCPVYVQVLNASGEWRTISTFHTRTYWATDIIDMTNYLPDSEGNLRVRLCFTSTDKIDCIGLDTSLQTDVQVHEAKLLLAFHSSFGNVKPMVVEDDEIFAELTSGQEILFIFLLPNNQRHQRTYILCTEGHYTRMP